MSLRSGSFPPFPSLSVSFSDHCQVRREFFFQSASLQSELEKQTKKERPLQASEEEASLALALSASAAACAAAAAASALAFFFSAAARAPVVILHAGTSSLALSEFGAEVLKSSEAAAAAQRARREE